MRKKFASARVRKRSVRKKCASTQVSAEVKCAQVCASAKVKCAQVGASTQVSAEVKVRKQSVRKKCASTQVSAEVKVREKFASADMCARINNCVKFVDMAWAVVPTASDEEREMVLWLSGGGGLLPGSLDTRYLCLVVLFCM